MTVAIRPADPADNALIFALVSELADYQNLAGEFHATPEQLAAALFGPAPLVFCDIAECDGEPVGFALWFRNFSTFSGRHGIYLEDIYVRPAFRRRGIGHALMRRLADRCVGEGLARLEWLVLESSAPSIAFYRGIGAQVTDRWQHGRLSGQALSALAGSGPAS